MSTATRLSNQLFQEDWSASTNNLSNQEAKISYLMVEKVTPPDYLWDKISQKLDTQVPAIQVLQAPHISNSKTIALMVGSAAVSVALILYWLI